MDKQKLMEEIAQEIADICPDMVENGCEQKCYTCLSVGLLNRGYGNIEKALTEFAESVKQKAFFQEMTIYTDDEWITVEDYVAKIIDKTLKEFLK